MSEWNRYIDGKLYYCKLYGEWTIGKFSITQNAMYVPGYIDVIHLPEFDLISKIPVFLPDY